MKTSSVTPTRLLLEQTPRHHRAPCELESTNPPYFPTWCGDFEVRHGGDIGSFHPAVSGAFRCPGCADHP